MMDRKWAVIGAVAVLLVVVGVVGAVADDGDDDVRQNAFTVALWGDTPYSAAEISKLPALIADINAAKVAFSVFDGDIKSGSSRCDNVVYTDAIDRFNTFRAPMVYVPGDNEWTDCHRINNGSYNALERLSFLRQTMFAEEQSFGQRTLLLEHQGPLGGLYAENTRWTYGDVVFLGLNIPGSNNNKVGTGFTTTDCVFPAPPLAPKTLRTQAECDADNAEYLARDAANISWLHDSFVLAKSRGLKGVMVVIQADMSFDLPETETFNERLHGPGFDIDGYDNFIAALIAETKAFTGQVVLVHGDIHFFKVDKVLVDQAHLIPNFSRVETFGSPNVHWVKATIDPRSPNLFRFEPMIVPGN
jgi:hypothetical protein